MFLKSLLIGLFLQSATSNKKLLNIVSIFEDAHLNKSFQYAIGEINSYKDFNFEFNPISIELYPDDAFEALNKTCHSLQQGIVGIIGPTSTSSVHIIESICEAKNIPHILTHWVKSDEVETGINFFPHPALLIDAYVDIINNLGWNEVLVLYVDPKSIVDLRYFIEKGNRIGITVNIAHMKPFSDGNYRPTLATLKESGYRHFVIHCEIEDLDYILLNLQQIGMLAENYNYFITNLDATTTIPLDIFTYCNAKIIGVQLLDSKEIPYHGFLANYSRAPKTELALIIDAVYMFSSVLKSLNVTQTSNLDCNTTKTWKDGYNVLDSLKMVNNYTGLTGPIGFDTFGYRNKFELHIVEFNGGEEKYCGTWNTSDGLDAVSVIPNTLTVITTLTEPYAKMKVTHEEKYGNDRSEGFVIDLIDEISQKCDFNYRFMIRDDMRIGSLNPETQKWSGMIEDIITGQADLAIGDVTITSERAEAVDFTVPFMTTGVAILYQKPQRPSSRYFSPTDPFSSDLWASILIAGILVSIVLLILGRISSREWKNPCPHNKKPAYLNNDLTLFNCFWFITGSLMRQSYDLKLRSVATRMVAIVWWFFTLVIVSFYIGNLIANIYSDVVDYEEFSHFRNFEELVKRAPENDIKFGAKMGGATATSFKNHARAYPGSIYEEAWKFMNYNEDAMVLNNAEGVERAANERYAFFMESSSLEYVLSSRCGLRQVGPPLDSKGYGIAMKKNITIKDCLNLAILQLQESGKIAQLRQKWWYERVASESCEDNEYERMDAQPLELNNMVSVFWITMAGILIAFLLAVVEAVLHIKKKATKAKIPLREALFEEYKFVVSLNKKVKPLTLREKSHPLEALQ